MIPHVAEAGIIIVGGLTQEREAALGEYYEGVIYIRNPLEEPLEVKLYQTDYL
jgi:hypothetical protein